MTIRTVRILLPISFDTEKLIEYVGNLLANLPTDRFALKIGNQIINKVYLKIFRRYLDSSLTSWKDRLDDICNAIKDPTVDIIWLLPLFLYSTQNSNDDYQFLFDNQNKLFQQLSDKIPMKILICHPDDPSKWIFEKMERYSSVSIIETNLANKLLTRGAFMNWSKLEKLLSECKGNRSIGTVKKLISEYEAKIKALEEEMRKHKKVRKGLVKQINDTTKEIEQMEETIHSITEDLNELDGEQSSVNGLDETMIAAIKGKKIKVRAVEVQRSEKAAKLQELMKLYQEQLTKIASIQHNLDSYQKKIEDMAECEDKDSSSETNMKMLYKLSLSTAAEEKDQIEENQTITSKAKGPKKNKSLAKKQLIKRISQARIDTGTAKMLVNTFVDREEEIIRVLNLPNTMQLSQEGIADILHIIKDSNKLSKIKIAHKIPNAAVADLKQIIENQCNLTTIDLSNASINDNIVSAIAAAIISNTGSSLRNLILKRNQIGPKGAHELGKMLKINRTIYSLDLRSNQLGDTGVVYLCEGLKDNECICALRLENNGFGHEGMQAYVNVMIDPNCQISSFRVSYNPLGRQGVEALAPLLKSPVVVGRILSNTDNLIELIKCDIDDSTLEVLTKIMASTKIKMRISLNIKGNKLTSSGFNLLGRYMKENELKINKLNITGNSLEGDEEIDQFAYGLACASDVLSELRLSWCDINDAILAKLVPALVMANIDELHLGGNKFGGQGLKVLCTILQQDSCSTDLINIDGKIPTLVNCLKYARNSIKVLNLSWIFDESRPNISPLVHLITVNGLSQLTDLHLVENQLHDGDILPLADVLHLMPELRYLGLDYNDIGYDGTFYLLNSIRSSNLKQLQTLNLFKNELSNVHADNLITKFRDQQYLLEIIANTEYRISQPLDKHDDTKTSDDRFVARIKAFVKCTHLFDDKDNQIKMRTHSICDLSGCELTDDAIDFIIDRFTSLDGGIERLDLSENCLGAQGIKKLVNNFLNHVDQMEKLKCLKIGNNLLGNKAMKYIKILLENDRCKLVELDIRNTKITIGGLKLINENVKKLNRFSWRGNLISQKEAATLFSQEYIAAIS